MLAKTIKEPEPDHPVLDADGNYSYEFKIPIGYVGTYDFSYSVNHAVTHQLIYVETGDVLYTSTNSSGSSKKVRLRSGVYKFVIIPKNYTADEISLVFNSSITLSGAGVKYISELDDTYNNAMEWNATVGGEIFENWIGPDDLVDWIKINNITAGSRTLSYSSSTGDIVTFELYVRDFGSNSELTYSTIFSTSASGSKKVRFKDGYEYFIKCYLGNSPTLSNPRHSVYTIQVTA